MNIIKSSREIDLIFKNGKRIDLPFFRIIYYDNPQIKGNVAFIAGKKNGNAVWRNKSKRIMREIYRSCPCKQKILMIAKKNISNFNFHEMKERYIDEINKLYKKYS